MTDTPENKNRRDFLVLAGYATAGVGAAAMAWPFIKSMTPAKDTLAAGSTEVDISTIERGQGVTVMWRGKPIFIRRRTDVEIARAKTEDNASLKDKQLDSERVQKEEWLIMVGICTHLGCVPLADKGDYQGWFCPCHGSHYDISGRIRKGPAPTNLVIPPYEFITDTRIKIG